VSKKPRKNQSILESQTREKLRADLIEIDVELLRDFKGDDFSCIAENGWTGVNELTDEQLVQNYYDTMGLEDEDCDDRLMELYNKAKAELAMAKMLRNK
jgi:hypothetical protein